MSGRSGDVYRAPKRDRHGDPINLDGTPLDMLDEDGNAFVGTLVDIIMGGQSASKSMGRQESSDTTGQIGCRRDLTPKLQFGDRIVIDDVRYQVESTPQQGWDNDHSFTGTNFNRYWVKVTSRVG